MTTKLVCTAELDLPDDPLEANKAAGALLTIWKEFTTALPDQGLSGVRVDARQVKSKPKAPKEDKAPATPTGMQADTPSPFARR